MVEFVLQKKLDGSQGEMLLDVDIQVKSGTLVTLYGPSGAGKTSILRMIAGLFMPDSGTIKVNERVWLDSSNKIDLKPQERGVGLVFQDYALFPNMSVENNLKYALGKGQDYNRITELIDIMELGDLSMRKPATLSGGQRQRVALARALVRRPQILLLDEPLSALDREIRSKLQEYILQVHHKYHLTTILVSHDVSEIVRMSSDIIVIDHGKIIERGMPLDVLSKKVEGAKFQFTGEVLGMERQGFLYIMSILIGKDLVRVIADEYEVKDLGIGDTVVVASKAFNPIIRKIG